MGYTSTRAHLLDELDRIDAMLSAYEATLDGGGGTPEAAEAGTERRPLALPASERERIAEMADRIETRCRETTDTRLRLRVLAEAFDLSRRDLDVLLLALAPQLDDEYATRYERLQGSTARRQLSVGLVESLFARTPAERLAAGERLGSDAPLRRHGLLTAEEAPDGVPPARGRQYVVPERIVEYLRGDDGVDAALREAITAEGGTNAFATVPADAAVEDLTVESGLADRLRELAAADGPRRYYWHGPTGAEKRGAVAAVTDTDRFLRADLRAVLAAGALERLRREAALLGLPVHLTNTAAATNGGDAPSIGSVFDTLAGLDTSVVLTGSEAWTPTGTLDSSVDAIVEFPYPSVALRRAFWERHAAELPEGVDPEVLAGTFRLTQGELAAALSTARSLADGDLTEEAVYEGCTAQSAGELEDLAQRVEPASTWDDIQLSAETTADLRLVADHVKHQARIYDGWGFGEQFSKGTGVVALFSGPSGTGKTMAAEILAGEVGMRLYRIDLSSVVSKYIGETEENLEAIFEAAENANAVLLFDEADAVFGDRAEVSDATDRYANAEVNYLLQRIEAYDGVVLMTTNYESNIDSAFTRRIDHTVTFARPEADTRDAIWRGIFPEDAPLGDIDYDFLAGFEFTGGQIKTMGQTAAILAAGDAERIEMRHVVRAIELEIEKAGRMLDPTDFGAYRRHLSTVAEAAAETAATEAASDAAPAEDDRTPEAVVAAFFDALDAGEGERAHRLLHEDALVDPFTRKARLRFADGTMAVTGEFVRIRERPDRVVLQFERERNGDTDEVVYDLRDEAGAWRIFDFGLASEHGVAA